MARNRKRWPGALEAIREFADLMGKLIIGAAVIWVIAWIGGAVILTFIDQLGR